MAQAAEIIEESTIIGLSALTSYAQGRVLQEVKRLLAGENIKKHVVSVKPVLAGVTLYFDHQPHFISLAQAFAHAA